MRFIGFNIPDEKAVKISLTYVFGIGLSSAVKICENCNVACDSKVSALTQDQVNSISSYIKENFLFGSDLKKTVSFAIRHLKSIRCYRGIRHDVRLPVRGQRTKTNARICKGRSRVPVAAKKK